MKRSEVELAISELLDGNLEREQTLNLIDRLLQDERSREFYLKGRVLDKRLDEMRDRVVEKPMSGSLWKRILVKSGLPAPPRSWTSRVPAWIPTLAAAILVLALGLTLYRGLFSNDPLDTDRVLEVALESRAGIMTDQRFLRLAKELLESDRKYQMKMLEVMKEVADYYPDPEMGGEELRNEELSAETDSRDDRDA